MAKFTLKIKRDETHREGEMITIGSRASCSFSLSDPLIAEEHCLVLRHGEGYVIEDLGTSLGSYLDGVAIKGRAELKDGATLVLGVTRLAIKIDGESGDLLFDHKGAFYYDDKADALDWSRKEVAFGQFLPVRRGGWIMVYAMIILTPFCYLIPATSEPLLDPGTTFHSGLPAYHAMLGDLPEGERGCASCHEPMNSTPATKCLACHEADVNTGHHPADGSLVSDEDSCRSCHIDHRGVSENALIHVSSEESCDRCHRPDEDIGVARAMRKLPDLRIDVRLAYETFSHADHHGHEISPGRAVQCQDCHQPHDPALSEAERDPDDGRGRPRDFAPVDYQACLRCHGDDGPALAMKPAWHGTEEDGKNCLECHAGLNEEPMRQVAAFAARTDRGFAFTSRSHADVHAAFPAGTTDACGDCHKNTDGLTGGRALVSRAFEHATHIIDPAPAAADRLGLSGEERGGCAYCHGDVARSETLVTDAGDRHSLYDDKSCAQCHTASPMKRDDPFAPSGTRGDFPHTLHMEVEGGCYACHEFPENDGFAALPVTPDDAKDCTQCHGVHANVGMTEALAGHEKTENGSCASCHREGDPVYAGASVTWKRWTDRSFKHASRGHRDLVDGMNCVDCHGRETWEATRISEVPIPTEQDPMCLKCHVGDKTRFHWR